MSGGFHYLYFLSFLFKISSHLPFKSDPQHGAMLIANLMTLLHNMHIYNFFLGFPIQITRIKISTCLQYFDQFDLKFEYEFLFFGELPPEVGKLSQGCFVLYFLGMKLMTSLE